MDTWAIGGVDSGASGNLGATVRGHARKVSKMGRAFD
jgi:hypothetical protein